MNGDVTAYTGLITTEHASRPKFVASVTASVQPLADLLATLNGMNALFDVDSAVGDQLDKIGLWVGVGRYVSSPISGVYFSFDTVNLGFDQGIIWSPSEPLDGLIALPDDIYRIVLKAKIIANSWDGTISGAYAAYAALMAPFGYQILIQDNGDMTMIVALVADNIDPLMLQLFTSGYLDLKPAAVRIAGYVTPTGPAPYFGFDTENSAIAGFDVGSFAHFN